MQLSIDQPIRLRSHESQSLLFQQGKGHSNSINAKCFSRKASQRITTAVRPSTSGVYDRKWLVFSRWCRSRKIPPTKAYVSDIADFLINLQDRGRAPVSAEGYRTAISKTFKFTDWPSIAEDPCIKAIIRSHRFSHVGKGYTVPAMGLSGGT